MALRVWLEPDPVAKAAHAQALGARAQAELPRRIGDGQTGAVSAVGDTPGADTPGADAPGADAPGADAPPAPAAARPGRPGRPRLVAPRELPSRPVGTAQGRAALLHAIAHIELNAIDLAADAVWRFTGMPDAFARDWAGVAADEARHFLLIRGELLARGHDYGDFDAHDGLWTMAERTAHDVLHRMALVPRVLEARALDATPPMQARLRAAGDARAADLLQTILDEEIGHVAIGDSWFRWLCAQRGLAPRETFVALLRDYRAPRQSGWVNREARLKAGFDPQEL
jgi:uncharacterized ferritin-like protein (DUF455 family)